MARTKKLSGEVCDWTLVEPDAGGYHTSCKEMFLVLEGTPRDNKMAFCPYCGRRLRVREGA